MREDQSLKRDVVRVREQHNRGRRTRPARMISASCSPHDGLHRREILTGQRNVVELVAVKVRKPLARLVQQRLSNSAHVLGVKRFMCF